MKTPPSKRWLVAVCIWVIAVGLTLWNTGRVGDVIAAREDSERLVKELNFTRRHAVELSTVRERFAAMYLPVASVKLGALAVRGELEALAAAFGLAAVSVKIQVEQAIDDRIPLMLTLQGPPESALQFLSALQAYPYLVMGRTRLSMRLAEGRAEMESSLWLRFAIHPPEGEADRLVQQFGRRPPTG
jgi:hypothetical protein